MESGSFSAQLVQTKTERGQTLWAQFGFSSKNRTPQVILTFRKDDNGQLVQYTGFLTDDKVDKGGKTPYERSLDSLHVVGFSGDDLDAFNDQTPHGRVRISTEVEEYNGTKRERVRFVNPEVFAMVDGDRMTAADLKKFSAKAKADKQRRASAPAFNPNGPDPDDNVNF